MKFIDLQQGSPEWYAYRNKGIGASDANIILGSKYGPTPFQLWEIKQGLRTPSPANSAMKRGLELEPIIRDKISSNLNIHFVPHVIEHDYYKWMFASLDGISEDGRTIIEIKTANLEDHELAKCGIVPTHYYAQVQHQMFVANVHSMLYCSFHNDDFQLVDVDFDSAYVEIMLEKEKEFYECLTSFIFPEMTDRDFIHRNDAEWRRAVSEWQVCNDILNRADAKERASRGELIKLSNGQSTLGCGVKLTHIRRKGQIEYARIPELNTVDLEKYRKPMIESWRITEES